MVKGYCLRTFDNGICLAERLSRSGLGCVSQEMGGLLAETFAMSISALTNAAIARRQDFEPANRPPETITEIGNAAANVPKPVGRQTPNDLTNTNASLQTLTTYIPTEVLTLYVSALAALGPITVTIGKEVKQIGRWIPFWCFLILTPIIVWIAFATKIKASDNPIPASPRQWPLWEMSAATIAYCAWAFALPTSPFAQFQQWYSPGLAAFLVLVVSAGLGLIAPLMQRPLPHE